MLVSEHIHFSRKDAKASQNISRLRFETTHMEHPAP